MIFFFFFGPNVQNPRVLQCCTGICAVKLSVCYIESARENIIIIISYPVSLLSHVQRWTTSTIASAADGRGRDHGGSQSGMSTVS